ncbi:unnamed protein product [Withania somnifera]
MSYIHPHPHSSTPTYFTQQAIQAGYVEPQFENKLGHIQHQPANMREALRREIEKEHLREKVIAEEIARTRRKLMMERLLTKQSKEGFFPFSSPAISFSPTHPSLKQQSDVMSLEERIARSQMGRRISVSGFGARLDRVPFDERISETPLHQRSFYN